MQPPPEKSRLSRASAPHVLPAAYVVHEAPLLGEQRREAVRLLRERVGPLTLSGEVVLLSGDGEHAGRPAGELADADPARVEVAEFRPLARELHPRELSNALKHLSALRLAAGHESGFSLVVEDDALFSESLERTLAAAIAQAPPDADLIFLGLPSPLEPPRDADSDVRVLFDDAVARFGVLPACESYLVARGAAARLATAYLPVRFATNVQLSYLARKLGLRVYLSVPNVFVDGSKLGFFASSLDANNRLLWNQPYCRLEALLRTVSSPCSAPPDPEPSADPDGLARELGEAQPFKEHPDVLVLNGRFLAARGKHLEAAAEFERAFREYDRLGAPLDRRSAALLDYIRLHRALQPGVA